LRFVAAVAAAALTFACADSVAAVSSVSLGVVTRPAVAGRPVVFSVAVSLPRGAGLRRYEIRFGDGSHVSGKRPPARLSHTYRRAGRYRVSIALSTNRRRHERATSIVSVRGSSQPIGSLSPAQLPVVCAPNVVETITVSGGVTLYEYLGGRLVRLARLDPSLLPGWKNTGGAVIEPINCFVRRAWSSDFSKYLFAGTTPTGAAEHIGVVDVHTGHVTDLTALRQQNGFGAPVLSEHNPEFLGAGGTTVTFGSDTVLFRRGGQTYMTSLSHPTLESPVQSTEVGLTFASVTGNHFEQQITGGFDPEEPISNYPLASPGGGFIVWHETRDGSATIVWPAASPDAYKKILCPEGSGQYALGWRDANHLLMSIPGEAGNALAIGLATLNPDGSVQSCRPVLPPTEKTISNAYLSLDGRQLHFQLAGPTGTESYRVSILGETVSAPERAQPELLPPSSTVFYPVLP
jgi:PKD domain